MPPHLFATILLLVLLAAALTIGAAAVLPIPWAMAALALLALVGRLALPLLRR